MKDDKDVLYNNEGVFYKDNPTDQIWWVDYFDSIGRYTFSFDRKQVFDLWQDYPYKLTPEQKEIFDRENPYWQDFFADRQ